jgi:hypothetical protein
VRVRATVGGQRLRGVSEICYGGLNPARGTDLDVAAASRLFARRYEDRRLAAGQELRLARKHPQAYWEGQVAGVGYGLPWQSTTQPQMCP